MGNEQTPKTLTPIMGAHGCLDHLPKTEKGWKAYDADDRPLGTRAKMIERNPCDTLREFRCRDGMARNAGGKKIPCATVRCDPSRNRASCAGRTPETHC